MAGFGGFATNNTSGSTFGFGTNKTSTMTFPTTTTTQSTFGATPGFGAPATTSLFGTTPAQPVGGFQFGAPAATTTSSVTFGTSAPSFNNPAAASTFGTPATSTPLFGASNTLSFGAPKTTASTLTFGTTQATTGLTFGTTSAPSYGLGTSQPTGTGLTFGQPATTQPTGFNLSLPKTTSTFGTTTITSATGGLSLNFGGNPTTTASTLNFGVPASTGGLSLGLFGAKTTTASLTTATTTTSIGLGGVDNSQQRLGLSGIGTSEPKVAKDNVLPEPIMQCLLEFQNFAKQQKSMSVEISHGSSKPLKKAEDDMEALKRLLGTITSGLTRNSISVNKLKLETAQGLHQAEMAQRIHETPPGLQYDVFGPAEFFNNLVTRFEEETMRLRVQMEDSQKHLRSLTQSSTLSPQELTLAMRRLHESLVVLAAHVQNLNTSVQSHKEQYKNFRRIYLKDEGPIFLHDIKKPEIKRNTSLRSLTGPTPFSETPTTNHLSILASSTATAPGLGVWGTSPPQNTLNQSSFLPSTSNFLSSPPSTESGFQLSKPPIGNKRNKR